MAVSKNRRKNGKKPRKSVRTRTKRDEFETEWDRTPFDETFDNVRNEWRAIAIEDVENGHPMRKPQSIRSGVQCNASEHDDMRWVAQEIVRECNQIARETYIQTYIHERGRGA